MLEMLEVQAMQPVLPFIIIIIIIMRYITLYANVLGVRDWPGKLI